MDVIIVGGGKMGRYLLNELDSKGHNVVIVEQDENKCQKLKSRFDADTVNGDGAEPEVLKEAGIESADVLLAVTKDDQDNLVICQIAERQFDVPRTFTTVNTPGNERLFDWLGVNVAVSSASILAAMVDQEVRVSDLKGLLSQGHRNLSLDRLSVAEGAEVAGEKLKDMDLPPEVLLVTVLRGDQALVPRGNTKLLAGDMVIYLVRDENAAEVEKMFAAQ